MNDPRTTNTSPSAGSKDELSPELYAELRKLAARRIVGEECGATLQPTVLVHEAWLRMSDGEHPWKNQSHFLAVAASIMRHILIDRARKRARIRHGGGQIRTGDGDMKAIPAPGPDERIILIDEGVKELEKINAQRAHVVVARFFGGLSNREIAESLGVSERSVERHWAAAKTWLYRWMQSTKHS